jgi:hypothetical protein
MIRAKIKEDRIDIITVKAIPPTNSTLEPSPVTIGRKEKTVVPVAAAKGIVNCLSV